MTNRKSQLKSGSSHAILHSHMNLDELRNGIDRVDAQIVELLHQRASYVHQVGQLKKNSQSPTFVPEREAALMEKIMTLNKGILPERSLQSIYRQIVSCSFLLEGAMRIGYLGPEGTWSHQAARARFGDSVDLVPFSSFREVFKAVEKGLVNYGVVPIENSTDGSVSQAMDLFSNSPLRICAQIHQSINNCLLCNGIRERIRVIYSHPQVLGQCRLWLQENFPQAEQIPMGSTTAAALRAVDEAEQGAAALGSELAGQLHGLAVLETRIQDKASNTTRFAVIGHQSTQPTGHDRTTICFRIPHTPGSLVDVLEHFKKHRINLLCLDSRPTRDTPWEYLFYVDVDGHEQAEPLKSCVEELAPQCPMFKVLGSYPEDKPLD